MKKISILGIILVLLCAVCLTGCKKEHKHSFSNEWTSNETSHWHACECGEEEGKADHTWGEATITKEATTTSEGEKETKCTVCGYAKKETVAKLKTVLDTVNGKNNDDVNVVAVVYGVTGEGFFASDATAGAYFKLTAANLPTLKNLKVGDEVSVTGKLSKSVGKVFVKNATATVKSSGKTAKEGTNATVSVINSLKGDPDNFGQLYNLTVAVKYDAANRMVWTDETGSILVDEASAAAFANFAGKKVNANVAPLAYENGTWTVYAFIEGAEEFYVNIDDVKEAIFNSVDLPTEVWGKLDLPTSYASEPGVEFTWTVKTGNAVTIADNLAAIDFTVATDEEVTLTLTISSGPASATKDYTLTVKAMKNVTIAEGKETADEYVVVKGLVVARGIADETGNIHYIIIMDETTKELATIDVTNAQRESVVVGDRITVVAKYRSAERPSYANVNLIKVTEQGVAVNYAELNPTVLQTAEDYQNAIDNYHDEIRLYKIVSPYMVGSGSTSYSWNQFGPSKDAAANGLVNSRQFSLLISNFKANGLNDWESTYNVPIKSAGAAYYPGLVMYVYSVYQTGATKWSFIIPCEAACTESEGEVIKTIIAGMVDTELIADKEGTVTLPDKVNYKDTEYLVSWSTDNSIINVENGTYGQVFVDTVVTLFGTFKVGEEVFTVSIKVTLLPGEVTAVSVSEAIALGTGVVPKLEAVIAAVGASSENTAEYRYGLMLTDGKKVIYFATTDYVIDETTLKAYDKIEVKGANLTVDDDGALLSGGVISYVSSDNKVDYSALEVAATVSSDEELEAFTSAHASTHGLVVKFVGPLNFVGTGSKSENGRYQLNYKAATSSAASRYPYKDGSRSIVFSMQSTKQLIGRNWWEECGMPEKSGSKSYEVIGSFFAVGGYNGSTLHAWTVINEEEFNLSLPSIEYLIDKELTAKFPSTNISAAQAGSLELPQEIVMDGTSYPLTWTSSDEAVVNNLGEYVALKEQKEVTLTCTYVTTKTNTWTIKLTFLPKEIVAITISEALAQEETAIDALKATVLGFASGNGGTISSYSSTAVYLTDGKEVMAIDTYAGEVKVNGYVLFFGDDPTAIEVGSKIELRNVTKKDRSIICNDSTTATKTGVEETKDFYNPTLAAENTITGQDGIDTYVKTITTTGYKANDYDEFKVYKLVGTAENPLYINAVNSYFFTFFYKTEANKAAEGITGVSVLPGFSLGSGKYSYFGCHTSSFLKAVGCDQQWMLDNLPVTDFNHASYLTTCAAPKTNAELFSYGFTGTAYVIFSYSGSANYPYLYHGVFGVNLTRLAA